MTAPFCMFGGEWQVDLYKGCGNISFEVRQTSRKLAVNVYNESLRPTISDSRLYLH